MAPFQLSRISCGWCGEELEPSPTKPRQYCKKSSCRQNAKRYPGQTKQSRAAQLDHSRAEKRRLSAIRTTVGVPPLKHWRHFPGRSKYPTGPRWQIHFGQNPFDDLDFIATTPRQFVLPFSKKTWTNLQFTPGRRPKGSKYTRGTPLPDLKRLQGWKELQRVWNTLSAPDKSQSVYLSYFEPAEFEKNFNLPAPSLGEEYSEKYFERLVRYEPSLVESNDFDRYLDFDDRDEDGVSAASALAMRFEDLDGIFQESQRRKHHQSRTKLAEKSNGITRSIKMPKDPLKNWCPECLAYTPKNHEHDVAKELATAQPKRKLVEPLWGWDDTRGWYWKGSKAAYEALISQGSGPMFRMLQLKTRLQRYLGSHCYFEGNSDKTPVSVGGNYSHKIENGWWSKRHVIVKADRLRSSYYQELRSELFGFPVYPAKPWWMAAWWKERRWVDDDPAYQASESSCVYEVIWPKWRRIDLTPFAPVIPFGPKTKPYEQPELYTPQQKVGYKLWLRRHLAGIWWRNHKDSFGWCFRRNPKTNESFQPRRQPTWPRLHVVSPTGYTRCVPPNRYIFDEYRWAEHRSFRPVPCLCAGCDLDREKGHVWLFNSTVLMIGMATRSPLPSLIGLAHRSPAPSVGANFGGYRLAKNRYHHYARWAEENSVPEPAPEKYKADFQLLDLSRVKQELVWKREKQQGYMTFKEYEAFLINMPDRWSQTSDSFQSFYKDLKTKKPKEEDL